MASSRATIRSFGWDDLPAVLELWRSAGEGVHLGPSDTPGELRRKWQHDPELFLVAEDDGALVGAVLAGYDGRRGLVYHLAVSPGRRRQGIGRALMAEIERRLASQGCLKSYLLATPQNQEAVDFYRRLGWQVMDMVLMGKELP
ncbi:MAG TPA: GNAT family acetyltransferase [Anaerolineales bacterium]|nr:GNAT family acetyltransferase [Anaerolineales bacterium]